MKSLIPWKRRNENGGGTAMAERPRDALTQMRRELDSLFERFFGDWPATRRSGLAHDGLGLGCR